MKLQDFFFLKRPQFNGRASNPQFLKYREFLVSSGSIVQLWPLDETSGTTAFDMVAYSGIYQGTVTLGAAGIGDGNVAMQQNGAGRVNIYSTNLVNKFPTGGEGSITVFARVTDASVWSDGVARYLFNFGVDGNNAIWIRKGTGANQIQFAYIAGGVTSLNVPTFSGIDFTAFTLTWSKSNDRFKTYIQGAQALSTLSGLGIWAGTPTSTLSTIGASSNSSFAQSWKGTETLLRVDNKELNPLEVAQIAQCNGFFVFDGDSRSIGGANPYPQQTMSGLINRRFGFINFGVSGQTVGDMISDIESQARPYYYPPWNGSNYAILFGGVNDAVGGADANTIWTRMTVWAAKMNSLGFKCFICTEIDGQNTALNAVGWRSTIQPALNTLIRNNYQGYFIDVIDFGADARMQDATNTTWFNPDKVHLTTAGYGVLGSIAAATIQRNT